MIVVIFNRLKRTVFLPVLEHIRCRFAAVPSVFPQDMTSVGMPKDSAIARYFLPGVRPPQMTASHRPRLQQPLSRHSL